MSPELATLVSYDGPLQGTRYPLPSDSAVNRTNAPSTASWRTYETSLPFTRDTGDQDAGLLPIAGEARDRRIDISDPFTSPGR